MNNDIKVIALDLDGTLLNDNHKISKYNKDILYKLHKNGIKIVICTGRATKSVEQFIDELPFNEGVICYNGAYISGLKECDDIIRTSLDEKTSRELTVIGSEFDVYHHGFIGDYFAISRDDENAKKYMKKTGLLGEVVDFQNMDPYSFTKMMYIGENETLLEIDRLLDERFGSKIYKAFSNKNYLEVLNASSSKGMALERYLESYGLTRDNLLTMGDGFNDLEMIQLAKVGVAMENAPDELKSEADYIAPLNDEDGVGRFLEEFFLLNK